MRIRQHVNPLKSNFFQIAVEPPDVPAGVPLEVELGSAEAHFLMTRAEEDADRFYVGVEIRRDLVKLANAACERQGLTLLLAERGLCTDNAAMIGILAERKFLHKVPATDLDSEIQPGWVLV